MASIYDKLGVNNFGVGGFTPNPMMQNRGISFGGMANPTTPPMPPRGFGTRVTDLFKDQSKFADALTGLALITGTPSDRALNIRQALQPTIPKTTSLGQIYDVIGTDGQPTGEQVGLNETARIEGYRAQGYTLRPVSDVSAEYGKTPEGLRFVDGVYEAVPGGEPYDNILSDIQLNNYSVNVLRNDVIEDVKDIDWLLNYFPSDYRGSYKQAIASFWGTSQAAAAAETIDRLKTRVFIQTLNDMRNSSKTGGAVGSVTENEMKQLAQSKENLSLTNANVRQNLEDLRARFINGYNGVVADVNAKFDRLVLRLPEDERKNYKSEAVPIEMTAAPQGSDIESSTADIDINELLDN